jgi:hypothetical protein
MRVRRELRALRAVQCSMNCCTFYMLHIQKFVTSENARIGFDEPILFASVFIQIFL